MQDAWIHIWILVLLVFGVLTRVVNALTTHCTVTHFSEQFVQAIPGLIIVWIIGVLLREKWPRCGLFLSSFSLSFVFILVVDFALSGIITTPFPVIDAQLYQWDQKLGFSTLDLLQWTYHQPAWFIQALHFCYNTWVAQLAFTPLLLALLKESHIIDRYMIETFASLCIGAMLYYFWPTIAPAGILDSVYFLKSQHELVQRFWEIHRHQPITVWGGGMIAFPSFHVVNCLLVTYAWRKYYWAFLPLLVVNIFTIFSTLALGYHYLVDVMAGFVLAGGMILLSETLLKNKMRNNSCSDYPHQIAE